MNYLTRKHRPISTPPQTVRITSGKDSALLKKSSTDILVRLLNFQVLWALDLRILVRPYKKHLYCHIIFLDCHLVTNCVSTSCCHCLFVDRVCKWSLPNRTSNRVFKLTTWNAIVLSDTCFWWHAIILQIRCQSIFLWNADFIPDIGLRNCTYNIW